MPECEAFCELVFLPLPLAVMAARLMRGGSAMASVARSTWGGPAYSVDLQLTPLGPQKPKPGVTVCD